MEQLTGVLHGGLGHVTTAEHLSNLRNALIGRQLGHPTSGSLARFFFLNPIVGGTQGRNLRQMGDADNLTTMTSHLLHDFRHFLRHLTTDTSVYLVEDDGRKFDGTT